MMMLCDDERQIEMEWTNDKKNEKKLRIETKETRRMRMTRRRRRKKKKRKRKRRKEEEEKKKKNSFLQQSRQRVASQRSPLSDNAIPI